MPIVQPVGQSGMANVERRGGDRLDTSTRGWGAGPGAYAPGYSVASRCFVDSTVRLVRRRRNWWSTRGEGLPPGIPVVLRRELPPNWIVLNDQIGKVGRGLEKAKAGLGVRGSGLPPPLLTVLRLSVRQNRRVPGSQCPVKINGILLCGHRPLSYPYHIHRPRRASPRKISWQWAVVGCQLRPDQGRTGRSVVASVFVCSGEH